MQKTDPSCEKVAAIATPTDSATVIQIPGWVRHSLFETKFISLSLCLFLSSQPSILPPPPSSLPPRPIPCIYRSNKKPIPLNWVPGLIRQPLGRLIWINGNLVHRLRIDRTYPLLVISGSKQTTYNRRNICIKKIYKYGRNRCVGVCIDNAKLFIL